MKGTAFSDLAEFLNAAGYNYDVFVRPYLTQHGGSLSVEQLVRKAVNERASVYNVEEVTLANVLAEFRECLSYAGDSGAGVEPEALKSETFAMLLENAISEINAYAESAVKLERFQLGEGHPAYPVYWDFAFLFTGQNDAVALIGSSSD